MAPFSSPRFRGAGRNGIKQSRLYLRTLVLMHVTNIVLDWVLIFGKLGAPALGTLGAGVASSIATVIGTVYYFAMGVRYARTQGFLDGLPDGPSLRTMVRLGIPTGLQQFLFFLGWTTLFWIVTVGALQLATI